MSIPQEKRGGAAVGLIAELSGLEAASVIYLRLWSDGADARLQVRNDFTTCLGTAQGHKAVRSLEELCSVCAKHGRRPLMRHSIHCKCLRSDESWFANFIATATEGEREDAMLIATLLVRPDFAPLIAALAADFGLALKRMHLSAPRELSPHSPTLH